MPRCVAAVTLVLLLGCSQKSRQTPPPQTKIVERSSAPGNPTELISVETNRGPEVQDGFRGRVHPLLDAMPTLGIRAASSPIGRGRGFAAGYFPQQFRAPFDKFTVAVADRNHSAEVFSAFLPERFQNVGQTWEFDVKRLLPVLRQIHPGASVELGAPGRRGGPNGGFALLRAVSESHFEIFARVHAEFGLAPGMYLTPACFEGRILVNRKMKVIEAFTLSLPKDLGLNVTLTAVLPSEALIDIVHLDRLELVGGKASFGEERAWTREMPLQAARKKLKGAFYKFIDIQWVKPESAIAKAREQNRPILAVVLWGDLDDQSC